jgi:hypothetical protein
LNRREEKRREEKKRKEKKRREETTRYFYRPEEDTMSKQSANLSDSAVILSVRL